MPRQRGSGGKFKFVNIRVYIYIYLFFFFPLLRGGSRRFCAAVQLTASSGVQILHYLVWRVRDHVSELFLCYWGGGMFGGWVMQDTQ